MWPTGRANSARVNAPLFAGSSGCCMGRPASDALTLTPRICGICSISQSAAAARALADAGGHAPAPQGAAMAALIHAVENVSPIT
jgi:coenzyme F420-reducing hydrogenase alpha subunit